MRRKRRRDAGRARGAPIVEAVLSRTLEELAASGLEGLSVERIARSAKVNKTSVYRRWPTREALVAAALEGVLDGVAAQAPDTGSLEGDLLGLLEPVVALLGQPLGQAVLRAAMAESSAASVAALAARKLRDQARSPVRAMMAKAQARGEWRPGVNGRLVLGTLVGAIIHRVMLEHGALSRRWLRELIDLALHGVSARGPSPRR